MKKAVITLLIAVIGITVVAGCGGDLDSGSGSNTAASAQTSSTTTTASSKTGTASASTEVPKNYPRKLEYTKGSLPPAFEKAVDDGFIVVAAFYNSDEYISQKVSDAVDEVVSFPDYKGQIRYFGYEISSKTSSEVAKLTTALGAKYTPHLTVIDGDKNIVFEDSGYIEFSYFEHALYNTVYKDKRPASD